MTQLHRWQHSKASRSKTSSASLSNRPIALLALCLTRFIPLSTHRHALAESFMVIIATEIGDRTFFIAAIMAMSHSRLVVWCGAVGALVVMTILSTAVGHVAPMLISRQYTQYAAAALFLFFGVRMLMEAREAAVHGASDELEEVEQELKAKHEEGGPAAAHAGAKADEPALPPPPPLMSARGLDQLNAMRTILIQAFTLTFLAEWGDRSQIATIALAAAREPFGVTLGACLGHSLCTGIAVIGGKLLASSISERTVLLIGGGLFCLFALLALLGIGD